MVNQTLVRRINFGIKISTIASPQNLKGNHEIDHLYATVHCISEQLRFRQKPKRSICCKGGNCSCK
jgi:hypothetical protein